MREKYLSGKFGTCPRVLCEKQNVIPVGISEDVKLARVKIYCPRCKDIYTPKKKFADVDGAYFGTSFPQLLLMVSLKISFRHTPIFVLSSTRKNMCLQSLDSRWRRERKSRKWLRNLNSTWKRTSQTWEPRLARWCPGRKTKRREDD